MTRDAWLAAGHHLAVFGLLAVLAIEWAVVRPGLTLDQARRVARIDALYGASAGAVLVVGLARLEWGDTAFDFYAENPTFWLKMASFATIGALSIGPTRRFLRWRRADIAPADDDIGAARRAIRIQLAVFPMIPVLAALMARGIGR